MLHYAVVFLVIALIVAVGIAKILFFVCLIMAVIALFGRGQPWVVRAVR